MKNRILIFRPDNIGDVFLFSGALRHIRHLYPDAHITLAVQPHIFNLVELCPHIDVCIPVTDLTWYGMIEDALFLFKHHIENTVYLIQRLWNTIYRNSLYDTIIYPVKSPQLSHLGVIYSINAPQIIGITGCTLNAPQQGYPYELEPIKLFTKKYDVSNIDPWTNELLITLEFLRYCGCPVSSVNDIKPEFWLADSDKNHLAELRTHEKIIGLFPGASMPEKCWKAINYGVFSNLMGNNIIYAILGGPEDKNLSKRVELSIMEHCKNVTILNLAGKMTLRDLAKTIMSCNLVISMDTACLHMAIAANVPTIGIVGGGHYNRFVPWGNTDNTAIMTNFMECFHCNWVCNQNDFACIQNVTPLDVAEAARKLMSDKHEKRTAIIK